MALVARDLSCTRPAEVAVLDERQSLTWAALNDQLNRATDMLLSLDLGPHRRIAVLAENAVETAIVHVAALLAGVSAVPVNFHLKPDEVAYILDVAKAPVVFAGPETAEVARASAATLGVAQVVAWRTPAGTAAWEDLLAQASGDEPPTGHQPLPNLMFTSGTTGRPKAVDLPPTMFAGGKDVEEHVGLLTSHFWRASGRTSSSGRCTTPVRCRACVCSSPACRRSILGRSMPRRRSPRSHGTAPRRGDGADPLRPPAGAARRRARRVRRVVDERWSRTPARTVPGRRQAGDDRLVGPGLRRCYGATEVGTTCRSPSRGVARAPRLGRPGGAAVRGAGPRRRRQRGRGRRGGSAVLPRHHRSRRRLPERPGEDRGGAHRARRVHPRRDRLLDDRRLRATSPTGLATWSCLGWGQHLPGRGRARTAIAPGRR